MTKVAWVVGERPEQALHGGVVLVVVEHDQPLRAARQELLQALHAAVAAPGAEAQREHLAQGVEAPGSRSGTSRRGRRTLSASR